MDPPALTRHESSDPRLQNREHDEQPTTSWWKFLNSEVDPSGATGPLAVYCFMTGFIDAITYTAAFVWCGFQTGNFLCLAAARFLRNRHSVFKITEQHAATSIVAFNLGVFVGRLGDRIGPHKRIWLISGTLLQALFNVAAAVCIWCSGQGGIASNSEEPTWTHGLTWVVIAFMAASLGLQGIIGKRLNTQFSTTVVLTAVWIELVADPKLFFGQKVVSRDHKILALVALCGGAILARLILDEIGSAATVGIGAGIHVLVALSWLFIRGKDAPGETPRRPRIFHYGATS
ncbi:hypothetical protein C8J57DRAFT_1721892 [Mycena rebaudengoi]|nr:hypothetical protein C8J57DRAFT_1721892 [Mycena rebaudengoi]